MTKTELKEDLLANRILDDQLQITDGQDCFIVKAKEFKMGDEIIYVPDLDLNGLIFLFGKPLEDEEIEEIIRNCYTGDDFLEQCDGDEEKARRLFWYCDWQHPSSAMDEGAVDDDEED